MTGFLPKHTLSPQASLDRRLAQRSLYYLCKEILGYKDVVPHVHGELCNFFTNPAYGRFRQGTLPRSWFKTWTTTVGGSIWMTLPDEEGLYKQVFPFKGANCRVLIASNISDNAEKMVDKIRQEWMNNERLKEAFPELVPDFNKTRWSNSCACLNRTTNFTEGTYTSIGAGGGVISQHFDLIIEDDLVYAKKDDFTGTELMPSQEDIDKAIGWHKLTSSLFSDPRTSGIWNVGTRWAPHDLIDYIRTNEKKYFCFEIPISKTGADGRGIWPIPDDGYCIWPERFDKKTLEEIREAQGAKLFETQYLHRPRAGEDIVFDIAYLNLHESLQDFPQGLRYYTFVDLASWDESRGRGCNSVVLTGAKDHRHHIWVARVDAGRYNPSELISKFKEHQKQFNSKVMIEEVQYQRSIRHFAKLDMEMDGHFYNLERIPADNRKNAKDFRIQGLEPVVKNGAMHVLRGMKGLLQELEDYPHGALVDRLDCLGFLLQHAQATRIVENKEAAGMFQITREDLEKELRELSRTNNLRYPFSAQLGKDSSHA